MGGLLGQLVGGWAGQKLYNHDPRWQCWLMGLSTMSSTPPMLFVLNTALVGSSLFYCTAVLTGFLVSINSPNIKAVLQVVSHHSYYS
jgi:hypothetical protein